MGHQQEEHVRRLWNKHGWMNDVIWTELEEKRMELRLKMLGQV